MPVIEDDDSCHERDTESKNLNIRSGTFEKTLSHLTFNPTDNIYYTLTDDITTNSLTVVDMDMT